MKDGQTFLIEFVRYQVYSEGPRGKPSPELLGRGWVSLMLGILRKQVP